MTRFLTFLILGLTPLFLSANDLTPWIPPTDTPKMVYEDSSGGYWENETEWCAHRYSLYNQPNMHNMQCSSNLIAGSRYGWTVTWEYNTSTAFSNYAEFIYKSITVPVCDQLDYPYGEDNDGDGKYDHCHASKCNANGEFYPNPGLTNSVCVPNGEGEYCEYTPIQAENADTGAQLNIMKPTGESCGNNESGTPEDVWEPQAEDQFPDPADPNNPPPSNGDSSCTPIGGGFNACQADPNDHCDAQGVCDPGCGTINDNFVCIKESNGDDVDTRLPDNDNTGEKQPDDPNTPGDEGTQSRLDGVLKNTDGLESLLKEISKKLDKEKDESHCPGGYYIGEQCVTFPSKLAPEQDDLVTTELDADIDTAKQEFTDLINNIKTSIQGKFSIDLTNGGNYEVRNVNVRGVNVDMGLGHIMQYFNIGNLVIFICSIKALFILLGSRND